MVCGTLFIPAGTYNLGTTRLRLTQDYDAYPGGRIISILGAGRDVTILKGDFGTGTGNPTSDDPNFLCVAFKESFTIEAAGAGNPPCSIQDLTIWNTSTVAGSGALSIQLSGGIPRQILISNCRFIGTIGLYYCVAAFGGRVENCLAQHVSTVAGFPSANNYTPFSYFSITSISSRGFWFNQGLVRNNTAIGFDVGFAIVSDDPSPTPGNACFVVGNRAFRCNTGFGIGYGGGSVASDAGSLVVSNQADRCEVGFVVSLIGGQIAASAVTGTSGPPEPATISSMNWDNVTHVVTVDTLAAHNITSGHAVQLSTGLSAWFPTGNTTGIVTATVGANGSQFTYVGPAASPTSFSSGTWTYPISVAIEMPGSGIITASYVDSVAASYAHIDLSCFGSLSSSQHMSGTTLMATYAPSWQFGLGAVNNYKCVGCSGGSASAGTAVCLSLIGVDALPLPPNRNIEYVLATGVVQCGGGDILNVTNSREVNFGATVACGLITNAQTNTGTNRLFFASTAGSGIVNGMRVVSDGRTIMIPGAVVTNVGSNYIDINPGVSATVPVGQLIIFDWAGGTNHYKVRYDGIRWVRIG
jgi:hypothetical protein